MSCRTVSNLALDKIMPVRPPKVKRVINPIIHSLEGLKTNRDPWIVANQLNTLTPVGTAMIIVALVK